MKTLVHALLYYAAVIGSAWVLAGTLRWADGRDRHDERPGQ